MDNNNNTEQITPNNKKTPNLILKLAFHLDPQDLSSLYATPNQFTKILDDDEYFWKVKTDADFPDLKKYSFKDYEREYERQLIMYFREYCKNHSDIKKTITNDDLGFCAIELDVPEALHVLLKTNRIKTNTPKSCYSHTFLTYAANEGKLWAVKMLMNGPNPNNRANPAVKNNADVRALFYACVGNHQKIVYYLVNPPKTEHPRWTADPNMSSKYDKTILALTCELGRLKIAKFLISSGANVHAKDVNGTTILMYAASSGNVGLLKYLLSLNIKNKLDVNELDNYKYSCLVYAARYQRKKAVLYLTSSEVNATVTKESVLFAGNQQLQKHLYKLYNLNRLL